MKSQTNLEFIWKLSGALMAACHREYRCSCLCSSFLYYTLCKPWWDIFKPGILWCSCVPFLTPFNHPSTITFIGLGTIYVPAHDLSVVWVEPVLPFTLVRKLDSEWLLECLCWKHPIRHPSIEWIHAPYPKIFGVTKGSGFRYHAYIHKYIYSMDP